MSQPTSQEKQELGPALDILETLILGIARFRFWIIPFTVIGLCVGIAMALIKPNSYMSAGKVWVSWEGRENLSVENALTGRRSTGTAGKGGLGMKEELTLLKTAELFERIALEVGPARLTEPFDPMRFDTPSTPKYLRWQHRLQDWWFNGNTSATPAARTQPDPNSPATLLAARAAVQRGLKMKQVGGPTSHVLSLSFVSRSPDLAQDVVATAIRVAIARHGEMFAERLDSDFVSAQLVRAREESDLASDEYHKHKNGCGFYDLPTQRTTQLANRNRHEQELERLGIELKSNELEFEHYTQELKETEPEVTRLVPERIGPNPSYTKLKAQIEQENIKLGALASQFKRDSDAYKEREESITRVREGAESELARLEPTMVVAEAGEVTGPNPAFLALQKDLKQLTLRKTMMLEAEIRHHERLEDINIELDAMAKCEPTHRTMKNTVSSLTAEASGYAKSIAAQNTFGVLKLDDSYGNMWKLSDASYNPNKTGPERNTEILMGLGGGAAAGLIFGILRQLMDRKLRYPSTVQKMLGVRVLGVIPEQRNWKRLGKTLRRKSASA